MSAFTMIVAAFVLAFVVISLFWGGPGIVIALPLALVVLGAAFLLDMRRRRREAGTARDLQDRARKHKVEFTERDEQTLVSE
jgi:Flp pilus assembly protein TadB